ncbi:MAG: bile acid:sodium symporter family protein [Gammaproteobacteria bacterium]|jgi:bile acid:Na+ symporter, BASS family|nr:bile acid:sodium symporter family protein [Gammaproteobacteria bacterium]
MSIIPRFFPLIAIIFAALGFFLPQAFIPLSGFIVPLLALIMFAMGLTLTLGDFQRVLQEPLKIVFGTLLQFILMPLAAYIISNFLELERELIIGLVLVGCCPGGTSSNVICYLAKGNLALSISLTMVSTLLSVVATPLLTLFYLGQAIEVPILDMMLSILQMVIVPVFLGVLLNTYFGGRVSKLRPVLPAISILAIVLIIAIVFALNSSNLVAIGGLVVVAVVLHNLFGICSAYGLSKLCRYDESTCRTIAIEVGMQNSALGSALASQFYTTVATLPGAIFSLWHNLSGSVLASFWSKTKS